MLTTGERKAKDREERVRGALKECVQAGVLPIFRLPRDSGLNGWPHGDVQPEVFFVPSDVVIKCMQECRDNTESWPYVWLRAEDANQFRRQAGLQQLLAALDS